MPGAPDGGRDPATGLRYGWTTGACAAAAALAAARGLLEGAVPDAVPLRLPSGREARFPAVARGAGPGWCEAGVVKDAGDDPDVTHGVEVRARVSAEPPGAAAAAPAASAPLAGGRVVLEAGEGVGVATCPGLPVAVGEPAVNPAPRALLEQTLLPLLPALLAEGGRLRLRLSVPGGATLARRTWNARLGIRGGVSILGTTGVVRPFSCSAWIASIHRGIDVARALGHERVVACTGSTSEAAVAKMRPLPETAFLDMGDFVGGTLKYMRRRPVPRVVLGGGFGKFAKLSQGALDLHSSRSRVDAPALGAALEALGAPPSAAARAARAGSAGEALEAAREVGLESALAGRVAEGARASALACLDGAPVAVEVVVVARDGRLLASAGEEAP